MWLVLWLFAANKMELAKKNFLLFVLLGSIILLLFFVPMCIFVINQHPFVWLYNYILSNQNRVIILSYWFVMSTSVTLIIVLIQIWLRLANAINRRRLTSIRKLFHILICLVYLPGLFFDRGLLMLCSYGMLILLVAIEAVRFLEFSPVIDRMLNLFVDEKDKHSKLILSHVYLLVGSSLPLWLSRSDRKYFKFFFKEKHIFTVCLFKIFTYPNSVAY